VPLVSAGILFLLTANAPQEYSSKALLFTGITQNASLDNISNSRVDYFATSAAYNNLLSILNSRVIQQEVSLRMLAGHLMLDKADIQTIGKDSYKELMDIVPEEIKAIVDHQSIDSTYKKLVSYVEQDKDNFLYGLLNYNHPYYSYNAIASFSAKRDGGSDVIEISYTNTDPGITYKTLEILLAVFLKEYSKIKQNQTDYAVIYFENALAKSARELDEAEDRLLEFNKSNEIINYYEQTKHISSQQEKIQVRLQELLMDYRASESVLEKLELETASHFNVNLKNKRLINLRGMLVDVNQQIANSEVNETDSLVLGNQFQHLYQEKASLESQLQSTIDSLYIYSYKSEGIHIETVLNSWLKAVIDYESSMARFSAMQKKEKEFSKLYGKYAPLGAILTRIERSIEVKENEYLELLHQLGQSKLRQQNETMKANMKLIDPPQFPISSLPGKRKLFIIAIAVISFIFVLLGLFLVELLDKQIKTVKNFQKLSGLSVKNAVLDVSNKSIAFSDSVNRNGIRDAVECIREEWMIDPANTITIQLFSNRQGEGKSFVTELLRGQLQNAGIKVESIRFSGNDFESGSESEIDPFRYQEYKDLLAELFQEQPEVLLVEMPALAKSGVNSV